MGDIVVTGVPSQLPHKSLFQAMWRNCIDLSDIAILDKFIEKQRTEFPRAKDPAQQVWDLMSQSGDLYNQAVLCLHLDPKLIRERIEQLAQKTP